MLQVADLTSTDLLAALDVHNAAFAGSIGVALGPRYGRALFTWFLENSEATKLVCRESAEVLGYALGAPLCHGSRLSRAMLAPALTSLVSHPSLVFHPHFVAAMPKRLRQIARGLSFGPAESSEVALRQGYGLWAIGVSTRRQRAGIGGLLLSAFEDRAWQLGYDSIVLTVRAHNAPAIHLYESRGWKPVGPARSGVVTFYRGNEEAGHDGGKSA